MRPPRCTTPASTFAKRISHSADSQDQRTAWCRRRGPSCAVGLPSSPIREPRLWRPMPRRASSTTPRWRRAWDAKNRLLELGCRWNSRSTSCPTPKVVRFLESGAAYRARHKWTMRTCFNAQRRSTRRRWRDRRVRPCIPAGPAHGAALPSSARPIAPRCHRGHALLAACPVWWLSFPHVEGVL